MQPSAACMVRRRDCYLAVLLSYLMLDSPSRIPGTVNVTRTGMTMLAAYLSMS